MELVSLHELKYLIKKSKRLCCITWSTCTVIRLMVGMASGDRVRWPSSLSMKQEVSKCLEQRQELILSEASSLWATSSHRFRCSASFGNLQDGSFQSWDRGESLWRTTRFHHWPTFNLIEYISMRIKYPGSVKVCCCVNDIQPFHLNPVYLCCCNTTVDLLCIYKLIRRLQLFTVLVCTLSYIQIKRD